ncbi:NACHT domain-containing protein [Amycolatopsis sp., V23-08]|uniref:NACHT domain-containing protein n=1 Tax=Amycolatopsis heterodermiae TaxID=3110235 RepID=A0ABU5R3K5_9PSEU|nr:NACHT domain-containing protein [Amycolatopsis sp., V23-08]MEA5360244.1 NACHT domain-containing protein [Amycolatopsis sp., V23-08]
MDDRPGPLGLTYLGRVLFGGVPVGSCFQVAEGVVVTACHVLADLGLAQVGAEVDVDELVVDSVGRLARIVRVIPETDLAVLTLDRPFAASVPGFALSERVPVTTPLTVDGFGVLAGDQGFRSLPAQGRWTGVAVRDDGVRLGVMDGKDVPVGMSGAPVRRLSDGAVVGVVSAHYNSPDREGWYRGNVWLSRVEDLLPVLTGLATVPVDDGLAAVREYLGDMTRSAQLHPYFEVASDAPALGAVYLPQRIRLTAGREENGAAAADWRAEPALRIMEVDDDCVVVAGPGMGKSSLLRSISVTLAERWTGANTAAELPVRVPAVSLVGAETTVFESIAVGVRAELAGVTTDHDRPPEFFATPPSGTRWLLLVDGLDEILDDENRQRVLRRLADLTRRGGPSRYRVVLTMRPLDDEALSAGLDVLGWRPRRYELLPFTTDEVTQLAAAWFQHLGVAEPERQAERFAAELAVRGIQPLARTPLMAAMLCQLKAAAPSRLLPDSRGAIYREFVERLQQRLAARGIQGAAAQVEAMMARYGLDTRTQAESVVARAQRLLARWAAARHIGDTRPVLDFVLEQPEAGRPDNDTLSASAWRAFIDGVLRRAGVLDERAGELVFLHHTLEEYFSASQHPDRDAAKRDILRVRRSWVGRPRWRRPRDSDSYVGFILDNGTLTSDIEPLLTTLVAYCGKHRDLAVVRFIAAQRQLGSRIPRPVLDALTEVLDRIGRDPKVLDRQRFEAAELLAEVDHDRGVDLLEYVSSDATASLAQLDAVRALSALDRDRGAAVLRSLATSSDERGPRRVEAAALLARLDLDRGTQLLRELAETQGYSYRVEAATALAKLESVPGVELLTALAMDNELWAGKRLDAARELVRVDPDRGIDLLATAAEAVLEFSLQHQDTYMSRGELRRAGLRGLGLEQSRRQHRAEELRAASEGVRVLADADPDRAVSLLQRFSTGGQLTDDDREWLQTEIGELAGRSTNVENETTLDADAQWVRSQLSQLLTRYRPRPPTTIGSADREDPGQPKSSSGLLASLDDPRAADGLYSVARDDSASDWQRAVAVRQLVELRDPRAADLLTERLRNPETSKFRTVDTALRLVELGDPRGRDILHAMALDTSLDGRYRAQAAAALARVGDPRGSEILDRMIADHNDFSGALNAIEKLAATDHQRATAALKEVTAAIPLRDLRHTLEALFVRLLLRR